MPDKNSIDILKYKILMTIGMCIDEESIYDCENTFIEMENQVIHAICDDQERYFKVILEECNESEYFKHYPLKGGLNAS